jgi:hypothetical protein
MPRFAFFQISPRSATLLVSAALLAFAAWIGSDIGSASVAGTATVETGAQADAHVYQG